MLNTSEIKHRNMVTKLDSDIHNFMEAYIAGRLNYTFFKHFLDSTNDVLIFDLSFTAYRDTPDFEYLKILVADAYKLLDARRLQRA